MAYLRNRLLVAGDAPKAAYVVYERCEPSCDGPGAESTWMFGPLLDPERRWASPWPGRQGAIEYAALNLMCERPDVTRYEVHPWPVGAN